MPFIYRFNNADNFLHAVIWKTIVRVHSLTEQK